MDTIVGTINDNDTHCLSLDTENKALTVVGDTIATSNFVEMNASGIKNIQVADPEIKVMCPNGKYLTTTHTAELTHNKLRKEACKAHVFSALISGSTL